MYRALAIAIMLALTSLAHAGDADTFAEPQRVADELTTLLAPSALPPTITRVASDLVGAARRHVAGRPIRLAHATAAHDPQAFIETTDGRVARLDSHQTGFLELFNYGPRGDVREWGDLYLFGDRDWRLAAIKARTVSPQPYGARMTVSARSAYRLPTKREIWIVHEDTRETAGTDAHDARPTSDLRPHLIRAGFRLYDTGPGLAIEAASPQRLAASARRLVRDVPGTRLVRGPRRAAR